MNRITIIRLAVLALFAISIILPFIPQNVFADSAWYSTNWSYRKTITVNGTVLGAQTNYQLLINVHYGSGTDNATDVFCNSKCTATFSDIRFANSVNTLLDYWTENSTESDKARFWVEFDSIPTAPNQATFYMYYGNPSATSSSNGTNTFIKFDDFEWGSSGDDIDASGGSVTWTISGANQAEISTDHAVSGTRSAKVIGSAGYYRMITALTASTNTYAIQYQLWKENASRNYIIHGDATTAIFTNINDTEDCYYRNAAGADIDTTYNVTADAWQIHEFRNIDFSNNTFDWYLEESCILNDGQQNTIGAYVNAIRFSDAAGGVGNDFYIDNFIVRNWRTIPPYIASWGSETGLGNLPQIQDIKVFEGFKNTGDWLFTIRYLNIFTPYYDTYDVRQYFVIRLLNLAGTEIARTSVPVWGNKVGCIYLSASQASVLNWGSAYTIQIYGTFTGNPYTAYTLNSADWIGVDLTRLDSWVITSAGVIGSYYSTQLTTNIATRGEVLNPDGATVFNIGIPGLMLVRPNLFQIYTGSGTASVPTYTQANRSDAYQTKIGTKATALLTNMGSFINTDGRTIGVILCILLMVIIGAFCFMPNHTMASNALTVPVLAIGIGLLLFDQALIAVIFLIGSALVLWQLVLNKGG